MSRLFEKDVKPTSALPFAPSSPRCCCFMRTTAYQHHTQDIAVFISCAFLPQQVFGREAQQSNLCFSDSVGTTSCTTFHGRCVWDSMPRISCVSTMRSTGKCPCCSSNIVSTQSLFHETRQRGVHLLLADGALGEITIKMVCPFLEPLCLVTKTRGILFHKQCACK